MRLFFSFLLSAAVFMSFNAVSVLAQESAESGSVHRKLAILEEKVKRLNAMQEQVVQKQSAITMELGELRIWIRRNRG